MQTTNKQFRVEEDGLGPLAEAVLHGYFRVIAPLIKRFFANRSLQSPPGSLFHNARTLEDEHSPYFSQRYFVSSTSPVLRLTYFLRGDSAVSHGHPSRDSR